VPVSAAASLPPGLAAGRQRRGGGNDGRRAEPLLAASHRPTGMEPVVALPV